MKKCQGIYSYIFSTHSLTFLQELRLLAKPIQKNETSGCIIQDIWLTTQKDQSFCVQFREIINEEEFLMNSRSHNIETLKPGFVENGNLASTETSRSKNPFKFVGLLLEDTPEAREEILKWEIPCEILWSSPTAENISHQLSYKKKFPFWAILLECDDLKPILDMGANDISEIEFQNKKAAWIHLETTSWDFLITESTNYQSVR